MDSKKTVLLESGIGEPSHARQLEIGLSSVIGRLSKEIAAAVRSKLPPGLPQILSNTIAAVHEVVHRLPALMQDELFGSAQASVLARDRILYALSAAAVLAQNGNACELAVGGDARGLQDQKLYTSAEAAAILDVSVSHVKHLMDAGDLGDVIKTKGGHRRVTGHAISIYKGSRFYGTSERDWGAGEMAGAKAAKRKKSRRRTIT